MLQGNKHERIKNRGESLPQVSLESPVIESFLDPARAAEVWPQGVTANPDFLMQSEARKELNQRLNGIFDRLPQPDMSLETAISRGHITETQAAELYASLSGLLESSRDYSRITLYLPFELLPDKKWQPVGAELVQASKHFSQSYMDAWKGLLSMHDVRANFVDGDVPEAEYRVGPLPRVVKAAHLIPKLVEKGLLQVEEVLALLKESNDELLKNSIADTLPVLADLGLLTETEIKLMEKSTDRLVSNMAKIIGAGPRKQKEAVEISPETIELTSVRQNLDSEFSRIDDEDYGTITEKRKKWLLQKKKQEAIEAWGDKVSVVILGDSLTDQQAEKFTAPEANIQSQQALAEGIRIAIESTASADFEKAKAIYKQFENILFALWDKDDQSVKETLAKIFRRLRQLGIVADRQLSELNINMPKLTGPFSENLKEMKGEVGNLKKIIKMIEASPELSQFFYPVVLIYGSRLKGYGKKNADIDAGVFVKPETSISDLPKLKRLLKEVFTDEIIQDEVVQFWLEEKKGRLDVRDFDKSDKALGESHWIHVLFGAAWEGNAEVMRELRKKLLVPYLSAAPKDIGGIEARTLYLEEIERDALQYRLMHNGYERFFPPCGGIHTEHADEIDGESVFWDSGYRQLATKLFASRVFLPKVSFPKK